MTQQPALFDLTTQPSPRWLCVYEAPCHRKGQAVWGAPEDRDGCVNVRVTCVTCKRHGIASERTA